MTDNMVVVGAAACIDQEQAVAMREPMLLRVVAPEIAAVVEPPGNDRFPVQAVTAAGYITALVVAQGQEVAASECGDRRFVEPARYLHREFVSMSQVARGLYEPSITADRKSTRLNS